MSRLMQVSTSEEIAAVVRLARAVWREHYAAIVGLAQVDYMLDKFQSAAAIRDQLEHGFEYYRIVADGVDAGYVAVVLDADPAVLFLSKIYVAKSFRGRGLGAQALAMVESRCRGLGGRIIRLTVNRHNRNSIAWYESKGFVNAGPLVQDIGNGFVMDDFVMEKCVQRGAAVTV